MRGNRLWSVAMLWIWAAALPALAQEGDGGGAAPEEVMTEGEGEFMVNCRQCHGTTGSAGVPLKENARLEDADYVVETILVGPGYMTAFDEHLEDGQIAAIATYIRNSWGNAYGPVTPEDVASVR